MKITYIRFIHFLFSRMKKLYYYYEYRNFRLKYKLDPTFKFNGEGIIFYGNGEIIINKNSYVGMGSTIESHSGCKVEIGRNCSISHNVRIYTSSNNPDQDFDVEHIKEKKNGNVIIGNGVWIGANVFINPGIDIGNNSIIGANSVVTKNVEENCVVGGVPAKLIRKKCIES